MDRAVLIEKYNNGSLTGEELKLLEEAIAAGEISMEELSDLNELDQKLESINKEPSPELRSNFQHWLNEETASSENVRSINHTSFTPFQIAAAIALLVVGGLIGSLISGGNDQTKIDQLSGQVTEMKEIMMLTLLKEGAPTDRLKAVSFTSEISSISDNLIDELLYTLNHDDNVNVRIATVAALAKYTREPQVRSGLINSIENQESPLVLMELLEVMIAIREQSSVESWKKVLENENTPDEIKSQIKDGIKILI